MLSPCACAAVNLPGFYYTLDNNVPGAVQCPVNTYGPGLKKQRACVPCPTGFTTNLKIQQTLPTACIVPAGYYLKAPGQVAPCPQGEYKEGLGTAANCTKCAFGVTTPTEAAVHRNSCSSECVLPTFACVACLAVLKVKPSVATCTSPACRGRRTLRRT